MGSAWRAVAVISCVFVGACGSDDGGEPGARRTTTDVLRDAEYFEVAAGDDEGWVLVDGTEVWTVGPDGRLTYVAEVPAGDSYITAVGDGAAVARFRCTDPEDEECGSPIADVFLVARDGTVEDPITLSRSDADSLEAVGVTILGASDERFWVMVSAGDRELFAVDASGEVEEVPFELREFAVDEPCVIGGELLMLRQHNDLADPELGPPDTGVMITPETPIRTTVRLETMDGRPVPGSEHTYEVLGEGSHGSCDASSVVVSIWPVTGHRRLATWTPDGGWVEHPPGPQPPPPAGYVDVSGCAACAWIPTGEVLRRGPDLTFQPTGLVLEGPAPVHTDMAISATGSATACAYTPPAPAPSATTTEPPPTTVITPLKVQDPSARVVCDFAP